MNSQLAYNYTKEYQGFLNNCGSLPRYFISHFVGFLCGKPVFKKVSLSEDAVSFHIGELKL